MHLFHFQLWFLSMGHLHQNSNMVQNTFLESERRSGFWKSGEISIFNDVIMLFYWPTASHALQQGVFVTI